MTSLPWEPSDVGAGVLAASPVGQRVYSVFPVADFGKKTVKHWTANLCGVAPIGNYPSCAAAVQACEASEARACEPHKVVPLETEEEALLGEWFASMMWGFIENASEMAGCEEGYEDFVTPPIVAEVKDRNLIVGCSHWVQDYVIAVLEEFEQADEDGWQCHAWSGPDFPPATFPSKPPLGAMQALVAKITAAKEA